MSDDLKTMASDILTDQGFARRVEVELSAQGYPEHHILRMAARGRIDQPDPIAALEAERDALVEVMKEIATTGRCEFQKVRAALAKIKEKNDE